MEIRSWMLGAWVFLLASMGFVARPISIASAQPAATPVAASCCTDDGEICCSAGSSGDVCCLSGTSGDTCLEPPPPVTCTDGNCGGDCNGDGLVTVDELVRGVSIGLGVQSVVSCAAMDVNGDQGVTVDELVGAVGHGLNGCPVVERYADAAMWLCRPGKVDDQCLTNDLDATVWNADGSLAVQPHQVATEPAYDCFYVYPTVDLSGTPGNHTDFSDIRPMLDPLLSQAAPFTRQCRVFAPLYRQVTIGTFGSPEAATYLDIAYSDVIEAFRYYMREYNGGRDLVIMGHSQGTFMTSRLLREEFDSNPEMRSRLIVALLIGGSVSVPDGQTVGGTFENLPLCLSDDETGCVIAYRSYADGHPPEGGSNVVGNDDTACTNPGSLAGGPALLNAYFPGEFQQQVFNVRDPSVEVPAIDTFFLAMPGFYASECVKDDRNRSYLKVGLAGAMGDVRRDAILYTHPVLDPGFLGTHVIDYSYALGDLLRLVEVKATAMSR